MRKSWVEDRENEHILIEKFRQGSTETRNKMIQRGLQLASEIADQYDQCEVNKTCLVSEGMKLFFYCIEHFDPTQGSSFARYVSWWMKFSMAQLVRNKRVYAYN